ncbi:PhnD/SsuA/transferrin family substrate-binding protein [Clostridium lacusfryxellense]|uniref:PhnD/SsuA/transferrin family substrate-binding protein n=1 Tax=Clostridium lacusfryxellense TaxID=205328 RepID=UPI001C0B7A8E|nr:PhnD/SsuA/transferrin family substrate-binding protein [Clostridium lacusfryxellense]MBU3112526.1 PhnD/SsuA/transferrin family substrate-binding protein [Clostridium lacusfryxellense]
MKKNVLALITVLILGTVLTGCSSKDATLSAKPAKAQSVKDYDKITIVWYPNESGENLKETRDELGKIIEKATGKQVEQKITTDYSIAIESIANGNAQIAFMGGQGYVEANKKNPKILPLVVNAGKSGTLDDAIYYSWLSVKKGNEAGYQKDGKYSIDNIQGKKMSFVSNSSTSGFKVPTTNIISNFSKVDKWKDLTSEDLTEGGKDKFFDEVLFGQSHQGSAVNLLTDKADVAAFCNTAVDSYVEVKTGEANTVGAVYDVKADAVAPFDALVGKEYVIIQSTPVLNGPFAVNTAALKQEDIDKITTVLTSDEVTNNSKIFYTKGKSSGLVEKAGKEHFMKVEDAWYNPIRDLSK